MFGRTGAKRSGRVAVQFEYIFAKYLIQFVCDAPSLTGIRRATILFYVLVELIENMKCHSSVQNEARHLMENWCKYSWFKISVNQKKATGSLHIIKGSADWLQLGNSEQYPVIYFFNFMWEERVLFSMFDATSDGINILELWFQNRRWHNSTLNGFSDYRNNWPSSKRNTREFSELSGFVYTRAVFITK